MQANLCAKLGDRNRESDAQAADDGPEAGKEAALFASSRSEDWQRVDQTMQEADGAESGGMKVTAMLASLGCGELARSIPVDAVGSDCMSDSRVAGEGAAEGEDAARALKVQNLTGMLGMLGCGEVLARRILPDTAEGDTMTVLAQLSQKQIAELIQAASVDMAARIGEGVDAWQAGTKSVEEADASVKFVEAKYGSLDLFETGLEGYVGLPDVQVFKAMMREHASKEKFTPSNNKGTRP
jgi:hypothetical protein